MHITNFRDFIAYNIHNIQVTIQNYSINKKIGKHELAKIEKKSKQIDSKRTQMLEFQTRISKQLLQPWPI